MDRSSATSNREALHKEWQTICMLLALATAANNPQGQSKLSLPTDDRDKRQETQGLSLAADKRLSHIPFLLARNTEIIATTALRPSSHIPDLQLNILVAEEQKPLIHGGFAAIANPNMNIRTDHTSSNDQDIKISLAEPGKSIWGKIKADEDVILLLKTPKHDHLHDYMATLAEFFYDYRLATDANIKNDYFYACAQYVTFSCWRKMKRRMDTWGSMGFIYQLASVGTTSLQKLIPHMKGWQKEPEGISNEDNDEGPIPVDGSLNTKRSDQSLYMTLTDLGADRIKAILGQFRGSHKVDNINNTMAALESAKESNWKSSAYNVDTCVEFHHFLVGLLLGYGRALFRRHNVDVEEVKAREQRDKEEAERKTEEDNRKREREEIAAPTGWEKKQWSKKQKNERWERKQAKMMMKNKEEQGQVQTEGEGNVDEQGNVDMEGEKRGNLMRNIWNYTHLLWIVSSSRLFNDHLEVLKYNFRPPEFKESGKYLKWANFGGVAEGRVNMEGERKKAEIEPVNWAGNGNGNINGDNNANGAQKDGDSDVPEEMALVIPINAERHMSLQCDKFKRWIRLNTSHLTALHKISGARNLPPVNFSLILVEQPKDGTSPLLDWHSYIKGLAQQHPSVGGSQQPETTSTFDAEGIIAFLQKGVDADKYDICSSFGKSKNCTSEDKGKKKHEDRTQPKVGQKKDDDKTKPKAGQVFFSGSHHCEMVASGLSTCKSELGNIVQSDELLKVLELFDDRWISVSKLCCPICWEFLKVLRGKQRVNDFLVRGHHNFFYPVALPTWLPEEIVQAMVVKFRELLVRELQVLDISEPKSKPSWQRATARTTDLIYQYAKSNTG